ncbi:MAG: cation diffusion facilitator family transporter [Fibromonadaceae bacterium]|jgi:cation diffusion facilitator family transporter|nr:cation diffusion facilitator family transporter [Fibromonadaceae bacterium]
MDCKEEIEHKKYGYLEGVISIIVNSALFAAKLYAGVITGSIALIADAWHTLSDSLSSLVVIIAVKISSKKPDSEHPFGHGRWEQIAALFIAFFLAVIAYDFAKDSIARFSHKEPTNFGMLAIVVTAMSVIVKELLAQYAFYLYRKTGNLTLKADGWHHRSDALSSVVVLIGIIFALKYPQAWWMDSVLGLTISLMLFYAVYEIAKETVTKLLGESPSAEFIEKICSAVSSLNLGDLKLHHFHIHNYVNHQELTMHIRLDGQKSIEEGHRIATAIEKKLRSDFGLHTTVHIEPLREAPH